ncbi:hypothetical protein H310_01673 [Aphanomyces invadans]|uniref:Cytosol aminopeptidase domain-containing protein n=1 Tax=Aphanomyces invadans TaxID=157072 RepID=A0A024US19_9STRA|nr:hypothetical protein H310_01673 [Aphanomyces invadans]ETW09276.1 hypothetical protein H310_01673 [Aphanomyces invadans]RHY31005.1 hypothetical protein DYB32_003842 [Aphanomyces invadans]|eukprot:XP_008863081.1 hypothetical protein H310_01673 [Aphanomyces invadans]
MVRYVASVDALAVAAAKDAALPKVVLIGTQETPGLELITRVVVRLTGSPVDPVAAQILAHAVMELAPTPDVSASTHVYLPVGNGKTDVVSVTVAQLPTHVSRYNTPARPHAISELVKANASSGAVVVALSLPDHDFTFEAAAFGVAKGIPAYAHKSNSPFRGVVTDGFATSFPPDDVQVVFHEALTECQVSYLNHTAASIHLTQRLVDAPANELNTDTFVAEARAVAARTGAAVKVIRGEELREQGFGGLYGVGKAAAHPPALVVLSYYPPSTDATTGSVALVGKGIVYDTGGLDLKLSGAMQGMKDDMGGAAGLLGGFQAAVLSRTITARPLHVVLCLAENAIGPLATRPDDIHTFYSGKTVEVNDTDAEGRLALGDGVAYAVKHLNPSLLVDMATLTGAQGLTTGQRIASVYANTNEAEAWAVAAGRRSGDLVHPVPYCPEFFRPEYKSEVADMKNYMANTKNAGVSCAGQFIGNHLGEYETNGHWIHVDMAYPVASGGRATGYGVSFVQALLAEYK